MTYNDIITAVNTEAERYHVAPDYHAEPVYGHARPRIRITMRGKSFLVSAERVEAAVTRAQQGSPSRGKTRRARWNAWKRNFVA